MEWFAFEIANGLADLCDDRAIRNPMKAHRLDVRTDHGPLARPVLPYGLAAAVWSRDVFRCFRMVKRLQAGIVWVNHMQPTYVEAPWGGYKMSGIGRELGPWGAEEYLQVKQVHINLNEQPIGWY